MSLRDREESYKEAIKRRQEMSFNKKDDTGMFKSIYKPEIKKELFFKCTEGDHAINIIPYRAGANDPSVPEGTITYCCDIYVHNGVGPNKDNYICMKRTYAKGDCPVCDYQEELRSDPSHDEAMVKKLSASRRVIYNIQCLDTPQMEAKGALIFEVSHFLFEKILLETANKKRGGGSVTFASDDEEGKIINFTRKGLGQTNTSYHPFSFDDRGPLPKELLKQARPLDELLHIPEYDEVYEALFGKTKVSPESRERAQVHEEKADVEGNFVDPYECPAGFVFGTDNGAYDECAECVNLENCTDEFDKIIAAEEEAKKAEEEAKKKAEEEAKARREAARQRVQRGKEEPAKTTSRQPLPRRGR